MLDNVAIGGGRSGRRSLKGRVDGSSRSRSECIRRSSDDLSSRVYCGGGPVGENIHKSVSHDSQLCVGRFTTSALTGIILHFTAPCDFNSSFRMTTFLIILPRGAGFHCEASNMHRQHSKTVCARCSCLTYACDTKPHATTPYQLQCMRLNYAT